LTLQTLDSNHLNRQLMRYRVRYALPDADDVE
jgi:hypothetical protein